MQYNNGIFTKIKDILLQLLIYYSFDQLKLLQSLLDLQKAFNCVNFKIILENLWHKTSYPQTINEIKCNL